MSYSWIKSPKIPFPVCRHVKGIVLVALADGTLAIFHRGVGELLWICNTCTNLLLCKSILKHIGFLCFKEMILNRRKNKSLNWILTVYAISDYVSACWRHTLVIVYFSENLFQNKIYGKFIITEIVIFLLHKIFFNVIPYDHEWFAPVDVLQNSSFLRWLLCVVGTSSIWISIILWITTCFWARVLIRVFMADCIWCVPYNHKA